jgi:hypothetical protein
MDERDNTTQPCCAICGKVIRGTDWACLACKTEFSLPVGFAEWPAWAKFLKADEQKRRRHIALELGLDNLPPDA